MRVDEVIVAAFVSAIATGFANSTVPSSPLATKLASTVVLAGVLTYSVYGLGGYITEGRRWSEERGL